MIIIELKQNNDNPLLLITEYRINLTYVYLIDFRAGL